MALKNNVTVSAGEIPGYVAQPLAEAEGITWHDNLTAIAVAQAAIGNNTTGPAATNTWARVIAGAGSGGDWLMVDPEDTKRMLRATGGVARIINYDSSNGFAIADFSRQQDLWRYQLTEDVQGNTGEAQLMELDGEVYAESITVEFGGASPPCLKAGEEGFCYLGGNKFYALGTTSAFLGAPVEKKIPKLGDGSQPPGSTSCDTSGSDPKFCINQKVETALMFQCEQTGSPGEEEVLPLVCIGQDIFSCLDLCNWICQNCTWIDYSTAEDCDPPCTESCTYEAIKVSSDPDVFEWLIQTDNCTEPGCTCPEVNGVWDPPTSIDDTLTVDCNAEPPTSEGCFDGATSRVANFTAYSAGKDISITFVSSELANGNTVNFIVNASSGSCQAQENLNATATAFYDDPALGGSGCCYIQVYVDTPTDSCMAEGFPSGPIEFPGCDGASVPDDCSPPNAPDGCNDVFCSTGGFETAFLSMAVVNPCPGPATTTALTVTKAADPETLGDQFIAENAALFRTGCGSCRRDTKRIIDRWADKKPTLQQIGILASTIHNKNKSVPMFDIVETLVRFMGMENEQP